MHRIGAFSQLSKVTVAALRYYDEVGLLKPARVDPDTGYRLYTTAQLVPLQRIVALRQAGLSIDEVSAVLSGQDGAAVLERRREEMRWEITLARGRLARLESILRQEDIFMEYQAVIRDIPSCIVFYKEGVIPSYASLGEFVTQAGAECAAANPTLKCAQPDYSFVSYVDHEYKEKDVGLMYAQAVTSVGRETDAVKFKTMPAVQAVCVYHRGSYEKLGEAYAFAMNWLEQNGYRCVDTARECYIDGCWNKEDPAEYLTELQFPVKHI